MSELSAVPPPEANHGAGGTPEPVIDPMAALDGPGDPAGEASDSSATSGPAADAGPAAYDPMDGLPAPEPGTGTDEPWAVGQIARRDLSGPTDAEIGLHNRSVKDTAELEVDLAHDNATVLVRFEDGTDGVYKPREGEHSVMPTVPNGTLFVREVAAYRVDHALGLDMVPTTTFWEGPRGIGSIQEFRDNSTAMRPIGEYAEVDRQRMAVLDYVVGNPDRFVGNGLTDSDGRPVAIDHGYAFPEPYAEVLIQSGFVTSERNVQLAPEVLDGVRAVHPLDLRDLLIDTGISDSAANMAAVRLLEVQEAGAVTCEEWYGEIYDTVGNLVQQARPEPS